MCSSLGVLLVDGNLWERRGAAVRLRDAAGAAVAVGLAGFTWTPPAGGCSKVEVGQEE